ncbi:Major facilitator superfamily [Kalmanozyma brasiliensis GHG001]|uniref:Major facilitator superfamily (MFS) profile domain-containing protein n=1 Tax=Kalmanozyma brasiliensis (strain GHG001) TaxID=1365824 RepID=V5EHC3_KALBG|nr:Major facilitator superfamily [Kalmanozyma brasiliensis GHG001]EST09991.1 Major facilitator superfamily [Kalmanozyma brasiliensis GHG001]
MAAPIMSEVTPIKTPSSDTHKDDSYDDAKPTSPYHVESSSYQGENAKAAALAASASDITPLELKKVLRKIDLVLMPLMCIAVLMQFLDKTSLNYASLLGIKKDTNLKGQEYSWLGSFFYVGYLIATPVHGFFLQKVRLSRYVAICIILWAVSLGAHAACKNYGQLVVVRLLLGWWEAALTPAFILLTSRFYQKQEQVTRTSAWFSMNGIAQICGGMAAWGLLVQKPSHLKVWQQMYLILGGVALLFGVVVFFFMPDSPATIRYLNERERQVAVHRIKSNKSGIHDSTWKWDQLWEAIRDPRLYLFFLGVCSANIANGGVSNFSSAIISSFHYDSRTTALLGMAPGAMEVVAVAFGAWLSYKTRSRVIPGVLMYLLAVVGGTMMIAIPASANAARFTGFVIVYTYPVASPHFYAFIGSSVSGTTKRIVFNTFLQVGYSVGNLIGPQTYRAKDAPDYVPAKITLITMFGFAALCLIAIGATHYIWNKQNGMLGMGADVEGDAAKETEDHEDLTDLTDKQRASFRYPY